MHTLPTRPPDRHRPAAGVKWTSGARVGEGAALQQLAADFERRLRLRGDERLPLVYLDVGIKGRLVGR